MALVAMIVVPQLAAQIMELAAAGGSTSLWTAATIADSGGMMVTTSAGMSTGGQAVAAMSGGFAAGGVSGGNLQSAIIGAFTALARFGVGEAFNAHGGTSHLTNGMKAGHAAAHAAVGCASAAMAGGKCKAGAMAAGFSALAGPAVSSIAGDSFEGNLLGRMAVGGVASKLGGGEFASGALSAAFEYLYNATGAELAAFAKRGTALLAREISTIGGELMANSLYLNYGGTTAIADGVYKLGGQDFLHAAEVKIGGAEYTKNQRKVYAAMERGDAVTMRGDGAEKIAARLNLKPNADGSYDVPAGKLKVTAHSYTHDGQSNLSRAQILQDALKKSGRLPGDK